MRGMLRGPRKRLVWGVFIDQARLSQEQPACPRVEVAQFRQEGGWDFSKPRVIRTFLEKMDVDKPGDVFFAPPRTNWRARQRVNAKIPEAHNKEIGGARRREEATFLKMAKQSFDKQAAGGRHAQGPVAGATLEDRDMEEAEGRLLSARPVLGATFRINDVTKPRQQLTRSQSTNREPPENMSLKCSYQQENIILRGDLSTKTQNSRSIWPNAWRT